MKISLDKSFNTREELDTFVRVTFGEDAKTNNSIVIEMSNDEMAKLSLSTDTLVRGVKVQSAPVEVEQKVEPAIEAVI